MMKTPLCPRCRLLHTAYEPCPVQEGPVEAASDEGQFDPWTDPRSSFESSRIIRGE
jgi:hypothetical protein